MARISTLLMLAATAAAPSLASERAADAPDPPVEPAELFSVPTGLVVESMDLTVSGTGVLFTESGTQPMATAALGLGGIAQMEFGTLALVSNLSAPKQLAAVSAAGLKVYLPLTHYAQGVAVSFQRTGRYAERAGLRSYEAKLGEFYAVATLANYPLPAHATEPTAGWNGLKAKVHAGAKYIDAKLDGGGGAKAGYWRPVAGIELWRDDARARVVGELNWLVGLDAAPTEGIGAIRCITGGVRFFFSKHATFDIGVRHQSNFDGIAESAIQSQVSFAIPTHVFRDRVVGN